MSAYKFDIEPFETDLKFDDTSGSFDESEGEISNVFAEYSKAESRSFTAELAGLEWEEQVRGLSCPRRREGCASKPSPLEEGGVKVTNR